MEIRDPVHGTIELSDAETLVIDSPEFQRLRQIKQLGFAEFSFPGATHNRYLHSIGVKHIAGQVYDHIFKNFPFSKAQVQQRFRQVTQLGALLHDIGHGLCSHASEQIYALLSDLQEFKLNPTYVTNAPGEILSYLIVKSTTFEKWFMEYVVGRCGADLKLDTISKLILAARGASSGFPASRAT